MASEKYTCPVCDYPNLAEEPYYNSQAHGTLMTERTWFDQQLEVELQLLFSGKKTLSNFKCFLMPNAWYLDLPKDHISYTIKAILAEQHTIDNPSISDEKMVEILKRELSKP